MIEKIKKIFQINTFNKERVATVEESIESMYESLAIDEMTLKVGADLREYGLKIAAKIKTFRETYFEETGYIIPKIRLIQNNQLQENEYLFAINDEILHQGFTLLNEEDAIFDIMNGLKDICQEKIEKLFTNATTEKYIDIVQKNNSRLVWNLSNVMPLWGIKYVLINILKRGKSIKNINFLFEKMCEFSTQEKKTPTPYDVAEKVLNECCK